MKAPTRRLVSMVAIIVHCPFWAVDFALSLISAALFSRTSVSLSIWSRAVSKSLRAGPVIKASPASSCS